MFAWLLNLFKSPYPRILDDINRQVNRDIKYVSDQNHYAKNDVWVREPSDKMGDCEDYALTKISRLVKAGIPQEDLDLQLCFRTDRNGDTQAHAVVVYKDDWVLDNLTDTIWKKKNTSLFGWMPNEGNRTIYDGKPTKNN